MAATSPASAPDGATPDACYGPELQGFAYPYPVTQYEFVSQDQNLHMAYMDVPPTGPANGQTIVLFHGKNFCSATWGATMAVLAQTGYRVLAMDQVGFCKSAKPARYQYSFQQLAANSHALLHSLGLSRYTILAHSTGGMMAIRYALMYPGELQQLVLVSPIGLEDWKAKGVSWLPLEESFAQERKTSASTVRAYETATYYAHTWQPAYEQWVQMYAGQFQGPQGDVAAWSSALLTDMIYTQPVIYELEDLRVPVLLISGDQDNTTLGKGYTPPEILATLGHYKQLAREAAARIPGASLVEYADLGHASFIQDPPRFYQSLLAGLLPVAPAAAADHSAGTD